VGAGRDNLSWLFWGGCGKGVDGKRRGKEIRWWPGMEKRKGLKKKKGGCGNDDAGYSPRRGVRVRVCVRK